MNDALDEDLVFRYMCGELPEEERNRLEREYFASDEVWDGLRAIEDEWIDQYVRGELTDERRGRFEQGFLPAADARHRVAVARSMARAAASLRPVRPSGPVARHSLGPPRWLAYAALVVAGLAGVWAYERDGRAPVKTAEGPLGTASPARPPTDPGTAPVPVKPSSDLDSLGSGPAGVVRLVLLSSSLRSIGDEPALRLPPGTQRVAIEAHLASDTPHETCRAVVETVTGQKLWKQDGLRIARTAAGPTVNVEVPAHVLRPGDYVLTLSIDALHGYEELASYPVTIAR